MDIRNNFSLTIFKISRFIIFGSVILFSCKKQTEISQIRKASNDYTLKNQNINPKKTLKQQSLHNYINSAPIINPKKTHGIPFRILDFDKIIAYDFDGDEEYYNSAIDDKGQFIPIIEKQHYLTQNQAKILTALSKKSSYGEVSAACFYPHLSLVFFKKNKKINQISICLNCNNSISEIDIPARHHKVINKGTDNEYSFTGFTPKGKEAVVKLCKELNFYYKASENAKK